MLLCAFSVTKYKYLLSEIEFEFDVFDSSEWLLLIWATE